MNERIGPYRAAEDITTAELRQALKRAHSGADDVERVDVDELLSHPDPGSDLDKIDDEIEDSRVERAVKSRDADPSSCPMGCEWEGYNTTAHIRTDHS